MSKHSHNPEMEGRHTAAQSAEGAGDILLAVARQERQRSEIQAKLNTMLDSLRSSAAGMPPRGEPTEPKGATSRIEQAAAIRARAIELFAEEATEAPVSAQRRQPSFEGPAAALKARLDNLVALESAMAVRTELHREPLEAAELRPTAVDPVPLDLAPAPARPAAPPAVEVEAPPAWQVQIDRLNERLERMEAASIMAATTLDSLVASFDAGQQSTFAAAQAGAREQVRSVIAAEVHPALAELSGASSHAHEEIHGVLTMLGTCLERVVGHLQKIEGLSGPVPTHVAEEPPPFEEDPSAVDTPPVQAVVPSEASPLPAPRIPLPGLGRRSKLAALIDFGFGSRAA